MLRRNPTHIAIEDTALADLDDRIDASRAITTSHPLNSANLQPAGLCTETNNIADQSASNALPPLTQLLPYVHLPYGPEREAILSTNLHLSHLAHTNEQSNAQSALAHSTIAKLCASYQQVVDHLTTEIQISRLQINVHNWRQAVVANDDDDDNNNNNNNKDLNGAADLIEKFTDLRSAPISTLAGVKPAESASDAGGKTELDPPIRTILGIEGRQSFEGPTAGRLYGAEEDVAAFLGELAGEVGAADACSGTGSVMLGAEGAGAGDEAGLGVGPAAALSADENEGFKGEETRVEGGGSWSGRSRCSGC